jgi:autotransporter-associated beta strand protein
MRKYVPLAAFFVFTVSSFGQTYTWDGGGSDDNFGTGANWNPDGTPGVGAGVVLNFTGGTRPTPNNNYTTGDNFGEWRLGSGASTDFTIGGNAFGLFGKIEVDSGVGRNLTINTAGIYARDAGIEINPVGGNITIGSGTPIELDGNSTLNVYDGDNSRTLTINGTLSNGNGTGGNGTLVLNQTSTVILAGLANDYGNTTIGSAATLRVGDGGANGSLGSGTVTNNGLLIFNRGSGSSYTQDKTINGTGTFRVQSGTVVGSGAAAFGANGAKVEVLSGGTINLNGVSRGANDMTYTIAGTGNGGVGAITNTGTDIYEQAGILNLNLSGDASVGGNNGRFDIGRAGSEYGAINGGGFTLTKIGSNAVVVRTTASNISYVVNGGVLTGEDNNAALGSTGVTVNSGASLGTYGNRTYSVPVTLNAGASMHNNGGGTGIWSGTVNLAGNATANAGSGDIRYTGVVSGSGTLSKTGANWVLLTNSGNTFSGGVNVSGGYLRFNGDGALGTAPGSPATNITLQSGGRIQAGTDVAGVNATLNANRSISLPSGDGYFHVWSGFTMNVPGAISGAGTLVKSDGGTLNYSGTGSAGNTRIEGGTLQLSGGALNMGAGVYMASATLAITGGNHSVTQLRTSEGSGTQSTINHSAGTFNINGSVNSGTSSSFLINHWSGSSTYNLSGGVLNAPNAPLNLGWDGTARLIQTGGTASLQGINFNNGRNNGATYQLTSGRLNIGSYGMNGNASNKWLELNGGTLGAYANWTGGQQINVAATSTIDTLDSVNGVTGRTITLNGNLSGTGGITKVGAGTLVLGGNFTTYSGATLLSAGTMRLNAGSGRGSSSYTASPGTTLELNGVNIFVGGHGVALANSRTLTINNATLLMTSNTDTRLGRISCSTTGPPGPLTAS